MLALGLGLEGVPVNFRLRKFCTGLYTCTMYITNYPGKDYKLDPEIDFKPLLRGGYVHE